MGSNPLIEMGQYGKEIIMTAEKMRQELVNYFENAGQPQLAEKAKIMPVEEVYENYKKIIEEDAYDRSLSL